MTHIVAVPSFANALGKPFALTDKVLSNAGFVQQAKNSRTDNTWLLPPVSNVTQKGSLPAQYGGAQYVLPMPGQNSSPTIEVIFTLYKPGHEGDTNYFTTNQNNQVVKITLFVPGENYVQIAGSTLKTIATAALVGWATAGIGAAAIAASTTTEASTIVVTTEEGTNVADFGTDFSDLGDIGSSNFDSFDFSDGESFTAFSDASNVDYGFGQVNVVGDIPEPAGGFVLDDPSVSTFDLGATPEPITGFGTTAGDSQFSSVGTQVVKEGTNVALKAAEGASTPVQQSTATGGGTKNSQSVVSTSGSTLPVTQQGASPSIGTGVGVLGQVESMLGITNTGQLKPNTGAAANGVTSSNTTYLIIGVALLAAYVIVKGKI